MIRILRRCYPNTKLEKFHPSIYYNGAGILVLPFTPLKQAIFLISLLNAIAYYREYVHVSEVRNNDDKITELDKSNSKSEIPKESITNTKFEPTPLERVYKLYQDSNYSRFNKSVYLTSSLSYVVILTPWQLGLTLCIFINSVYLARELLHIEKTAEQETLLKDLSRINESNSTYRPPLNALEYSTMIIPAPLPVFTPSDNDYFSPDGSTTTNDFLQSSTLASPFQIAPTYPLQSATPSVPVMTSIYLTPSNSSDSLSSPPELRRVINPKILSLMGKFEAPTK